jgi:hypothetical protein
MLLDIELCHIYLRDFLSNGLSPADVASIADARRRAELFVAGQCGNAVRFSVMVDDEEGAVDHSASLESIRDRIISLGITPSRLIYESSLIRYADALVESLRPNTVAIDGDHVYLNVATEDRLLWAEENLRETKSIKRLFLETIDEPGSVPPRAMAERNQARFWVPLRSGKAPSRTGYGCSLLTATWYLHRLGVEGFSDEAGPRPDGLLNILPLKYMKNEGIALDILHLSATTRIRKARTRINYVYI